MPTRSHELVVIPRDELTRAHQWAAKNAQTGVAILIASVVAVAMPWLVMPQSFLTIAVLIGGAVGSTLGLVKLVRARRAMAAIRAKLDEQTLPSARLLR